MTPWDELTPTWRACLETAWGAYGRKTTPVGAIVVDGAGRTVAEGANDRHAASGDGSPAGSHLRPDISVFEGPADVLGTFAAALHVEFSLRRTPEGHVVAAYAAAAAGAPLAESFDGSVRRLAEKGGSPSRG